MVPVAHVSQLAQAPMRYQALLAILTTALWLVQGVQTPTRGHLPSVHHQHDGEALGLAAALSRIIPRLSEQVSVSGEQWDPLG